MPTVTVQGAATLQEAAKALQDSRYEVVTHGSGAQEAPKQLRSRCVRNE